MNKQEAVKILKEFHDTSALFSVRTALETVFPELKEDEDELEWLKQFIQEEVDSLSIDIRDNEDQFRLKMLKRSLEWLEKQGEQKPFDYENANIQQKDFAPKATTANRQLYNRAILTILSNYVEKYPDVRFVEMLCNLGFHPHFDEESRETYYNLNETINKQKS